MACVSTEPKIDRIRYILCCLILGLQIGGVIFARFSDLRYFCWAPNDQHTEYQIDAVVNGRRLTGEEINARYRIPAAGYDERSYAHAWNKLLAYELTYGSEPVVQINMKYRVNGKEWRKIAWKKP
jgi:hypothetical protein